jgi:hypothetical protein
MLHGRWLDRADLDRRLLAFKGFLSNYRTWLRLGLLNGGIIYGEAVARFGDSAVVQNEELRTKISQHITRFETLTDSLAAMKMGGQSEVRMTQSVVVLLARELEVIRALIPSERYVAFDPLARVWLREQARQGHRVEVSGVMLTP